MSEGKVNGNAYTNGDLDVIRPIGYSWAELAIRNPPVERMIMTEQDTSEFTCGVEVGPIDCGIPIMRVLHKRLEGWVQRSQMGKVRWILRILVVGVNGGSVVFSLPFLVFAPHRENS